MCGGSVLFLGLFLGFLFLGFSKTIVTWELMLVLTEFYF